MKEDYNENLIETYNKVKDFIVFLETQINNNKEKEN